MGNRLSYSGLKCPVCHYSLEGLTEPVCPECGNPFDPDWLYSVDYEYSIQWTPRRKLIAWLFVVVLAIGLVYGLFAVGAVYAFVILSITGWGVVMYVGRQSR